MLPREADAAEHLDRAAAELRERLARERLGHRCRAVRLGRVGVVGGPARVVAGGATELERAQHVGAEMLHGLERSDRMAERDALLRVLDRELERAPRRRRRRSPSRRPCGRPCGPRCRRVAAAEPPARGAVEHDRRLLAGAVDRLHRFDGDTTRLGLHREDRGTRLARDRGGHEHDVASDRVGHVHLGARDHPAFAEPRGRRGRRVDLETASGLEQRDGADHRTAGHSRQQERVLALGSRAEHERDRADRRRDVGARVHGAAHLLEHDRGVDHAHPRAAVALGHEQADDTELRERVPHRREAIVVAVEERAHVAGDRRARRGNGAPNRAAAPGRRRTRSPHALQLVAAGLARLRTRTPADC